MSNGAPFELSPVEEAVAAVQAGEIVVVVDDMDRENEGDCEQPLPFPFVVLAS